MYINLLKLSSQVRKNNCLFFWGGGVVVYRHNNNSINKNRQGWYVCVFVDDGLGMDRLWSIFRVSCSDVFCFCFFNKYIFFCLFSLWYCLDKDKVGTLGILGNYLLHISLNEHWVKCLVPGFRICRLWILILFLRVYSICPM